jgi:hypothetical protein
LRTEHRAHKGWHRFRDDKRNREARRGRHQKAAAGGAAGNRDAIAIRFVRGRPLMRAAVRHVLGTRHASRIRHVHCFCGWGCMPRAARNRQHSYREGDNRSQYGPTDVHAESSGAPISGRAPWRVKGQFFGRAGPTPNARIGRRFDLGQSFYIHPSSVAVVEVDMGFIGRR